MNAARTNITIRLMAAADFSEIVALQARVFPELLRWTGDELARHIAVFPEGQHVAVDDAGK